jgi:Domain of unknown function (DUF5666)
MKMTTSFIQASMARLIVIVLATLILLPSCGGAGGVSGGGTGGNPIGVGSGDPTFSISIKPQGGLGRKDFPVSTSSLSSLGSGTVFLGSRAFFEAATTVSAADGFGFPARVDLGSQLLIVPTQRNFADAALLSIANRYSIRAAVGRLIYDATLPSNEQLRVNGQRVLTNRLTVLAGASTAAQLANQTVIVSGYLDPLRNDLIATRIEALPAGVDLMGQTVISGQINSIDTPSKTASLGFATIDISGVNPATPVRIGQQLNLRVMPSTTQVNVLTPIEVQDISAVVATGDVEMRGIVTSKPLATQPNAPLIIGGYEIKLSDNLKPILNQLRIGSIAQVFGSQNGSLVITAQALSRVANPIIFQPTPDEPDLPPDDLPKNNEPRNDYSILDAVIEQLDTTQRSFVVRGTRVQLHEGQASAPLVNGQMISVRGELKSDAAGQYLLASVLPK